MTKDKIFNWKFCLCCGLFIWFVVNLLQGIFTEIQEDEAYYALYGEHLAWGYYDHPPMVGLMTFLSSIFFSGTLGVRFFTIITSCLSLIVIWLVAISRPYDKAKVVELVEIEDSRSQTPTSMKRPFDPSTGSGLRDLNPKSVLLFFIIACSVVMFNIYGFVTTPDAALILFSALFLFVYQRYLNDNTWKNALLMGVMMALMIYKRKIWPELRLICPLNNSKALCQSNRISTPLRFVYMKPFAGRCLGLLTALMLKQKRLFRFQSYYRIFRRLLML